MSMNKDWLRNLENTIHFERKRYTRDAFFIKKALRLAKNGVGKTSPNPCVGAILVKNGKVIGEGWHKKAGGPHAEILAIRDCENRGKQDCQKHQKKTEGSTLYVSLSPCCHYGKTGPCAKAIVDAKIQRVVAAIKDPNPLCQDTPTIFKKNNIEYFVGIMEQEARKLNLPYFKEISKKRDFTNEIAPTVKKTKNYNRIPFVTLKMALSQNGKISGQQGRYITCIESQKYVHGLRRNVDAIITGIGTILADNPHLGVRHVKGKDPKRIILDSSLKISYNATVLRDKNVLIITTKKASKEKKDLLSKKAEIMVVENMKNLKKILILLEKKGIKKILVEGGKKVAKSFLRHRMVDRMLVFFSPDIIQKGIDFSNLLASLEWKEKIIRKIGKDLLWEGSLFFKNEPDKNKVKKKSEKNRNKKNNNKR